MSAAASLTRAIIANIGTFGAAAAIEEICSRPWASATFTGARHRFRLRLDGPSASAAADGFLRGLAEREFDLAGHILADIGLVQDLREDGVRLVLEALTVEMD